MPDKTSFMIIIIKSPSALLELNNLIWSFDLIIIRLPSAKLRDVIPKKNVCFFISLIKGGGSFPFIKIYVADFV